jgi:hypothetical protein
VDQVLESLPTKYKDLSSNSSTPESLFWVSRYISVILATWEVEIGDCSLKTPQAKVSKTYLKKHAGHDDVCL